MPLNENVSWEEVGAISTGGDGHVRDAFKGGFAKKVLLDPTFKLYKFNEYDTLAARNSDKVSPWWSPYEPYEWDPGWLQRKKTAQDLRVDIRELGRVTSTKKENWNSLSYLLVIELAHATYAYFGGFAQTQRIDPGGTSKRKAGEGSGGTKNLPGGGTQFYIPNLTTGDIVAWHAELLA